MQSASSCGRGGREPLGEGSSKTAPLQCTLTRDKSRPLPQNNRVRIEQKTKSVARLFCGRGERSTIYRKMADMTTGRCESVTLRTLRLFAQLAAFGLREFAVRLRKI